MRWQSRTLHLGIREIFDLNRRIAFDHLGHKDGIVWEQAIRATKLAGTAFGVFFLLEKILKCSILCFKLSKLLAQSIILCLKFCLS